MVQFLYGEDGVDPAKSDHASPEVIKSIVSDVVGKDLEKVV